VKKHLTLIAFVSIASGLPESLRLSIDS